MSDFDQILEHLLDEDQLDQVKRQILDLSDDILRQRVIERLFVSDLNYPGASPHRGWKLISLGLHAFLAPEAIERIKQAAFICLTSSALEAQTARIFGQSLDGLSKSSHALPLTETQLERRRPVWSALSELFLDNEIRPEIAHAAFLCDASGYTVSELREIWFQELSPLLSKNLLSPAGEWAGFDQRWLEESIIARRGVKAGPYRCANQATWSELSRIVNWLRAWPAHHRSALSECIRAQVGSAVSGVTPGRATKHTLTQDEIECCWNVVTKPLLQALHIDGSDPPLADLLARGRPQ